MDAAIERLFGLVGLMAPRQAEMRPTHLKDAGTDAVQTIGGLQIVRPRP